MSVKYLSDSDKDFECLEAYLRSGGLGELKDEWVVSVEKETKLFSENAQKILKNYLEGDDIDSIVDKTYSGDILLPTRYDSISQNSILMSLIDRIRKSVADLGINHDDFPYSSCIPTGLVNACAIKLPCSSKEFLLFDSQLFAYCNLFAKAFALCLPITRSDKNNIQLSVSIDAVKKQIDENANQCLTRLLDIIHSYAALNRPMKAKAYLPPKDYITYVNILRDGMELMVVGHEFGHINLGHLGGLVKYISMDTRLGEMSKDHRQEHEADFIGLALSLQSLVRSGYDASLSFIGTDLFFSSMILAERYKSYLAGIKDEHFEEEETASHPTFTNRREFIRLAINSIDGVKEHGDEIRQLVAFYDEVIEYAWEKISKIIDRARTKDGRR